MSRALPSHSGSVHRCGQLISFRARNSPSPRPGVVQDSRPWRKRRCAGRQDGHSNSGIEPWQVDFLCFSSLYGDTIEIPHISCGLLQLGEIDIAPIGAPATEVQQGARQAPRGDACLAFCHRFYQLLGSFGRRQKILEHPDLVVRPALRECHALTARVHNESPGRLREEMEFFARAARRREPPKIAALLEVAGHQHVLSVRHPCGG